MQQNGLQFKKLCAIVKLLRCSNYSIIGQKPFHRQHNQPHKGSHTMNNTFNFGNTQQVFAAQASDFAKVFSAHATKIAAAQQAWLQGQTDAFKAQFEQAAGNKDLTVDFSKATQAAQNNLQPAAQSLIKHAQELFALTLSAQKELAAKVQDGYQAAAIEANASVEAGIKQLPNQGEPFVGMAKNAAQALTGAYEQVAAQVKTAQDNLEAQIGKLFDNALTAVASPVVAGAAKAKK
jgi:hypothetical protein